MIEEHFVSVRQACKEVGLPKSSYLYQAREKDDQPIIDQLSELIENHPSIGFWMCYHRLRIRGFSWNHKRVYRVYTAMKLNIRRRAKKRLPARAKRELFQPTEPNQVWSIDFMHDSLWNGRTYRLLNILDDYNRQVLAIEVDSSIPAQRVIRVLERLKEVRGLPKMIRVDNGPEFISKMMDFWCHQNKIELAFIQPGEPTQNAYIERFNGSLRRELLNAYIFKTIGEVKEKTYYWMKDYNENRPHKALNYKVPLEVIEQTKQT
jgi:putative transposase